jgi:nucleoside-diphosphate-sugar epimerase
MRIFIAGATGVLGRRMIPQFLERGHSVIGLARNEENEAIIRHLGASPCRGDLFDVNSLTDAAAGADVIVHAATAIPTAQKVKPQDWEMNDRIRRDGTRALAQCAARVGARAFLVESIAWVARPADQSAFDEDSPVNPDSVSQSCADLENIALDAGRDHRFRTAVLRFGWFYAPEASHTKSFGELLVKRQLPIIGKGDAIWSSIHVHDAASAFVAAAEGKAGGIFHVVDDQPVTSEEYLTTFATGLGAPPPRRVPVWLARLLAGSHAVNFLNSSTRTTNARFKRNFAWTPKFPTYREGLQDVLQEWRAENFLHLGTKLAA